MNDSEIIDSIVDYLCLEYGEDPNKPESLKKSDLKYVGEYMYDGNPTYFWWYPSRDGQSWATVYLMAGVECIGMTTTSPDSLEKIT